MKALNEFVDSLFEPNERMWHIDVCRFTNVRTINLYLNIDTLDTEKRQRLITLCKDNNVNLFSRPDVHNYYLLQ